MLTFPFKNFSDEPRIYIACILTVALWHNISVAQNPIILCASKIILHSTENFWNRNGEEAEVETSYMQYDPCQPDRHLQKKAELRILYNDELLIRRRPGF